VPAPAPSAPAPAPPPPSPATATVDADAAVTGPGPSQPLAGFANDRAFLRSPSNTFVLFPQLRLDVDAALFPRQVPKSGAFVRRAHLELAAWLGPMFYVDASGDFASEPPPATPDPVLPSALATADDYVAFAPMGDLIIVQAGQFDAPFTMENRTLDPYTDFIERSLAVRVLGVPTQKEVGLMVHGLVWDERLHYSLGVFNGDGPNFRNVDNQVDVIGRAFIAPFAASSAAGIRRISVGVSGWYGQHLSGLPFPTQTTAGGFKFFDPTWTSGQGTPTNPATKYELHQYGRMLAGAAEANVPIGSTLGLRGEFVYKDQVMAEDDITNLAQGMITTMGAVELRGLAGYGEVYFWLVGDERQLPRPGLEQPLRLPAIPVMDAPPEQGLMLALRGEFVKEDMTTNRPILGDPNVATTRVVAGSVGLNYWYGRRVRASVNYVLNQFSGTTESVKSIAAAGAFEHELLLRLGASL